MSVYPYLPLFVDEFISSATSLTAAETGAHIKLLAHAWRATDCCLPDDDRKLSRLAGVDAKTWKSLKPNVMELWALADGRWTHNMLTRERAHAIAITEKRRAAAAKRWGGKGDANALQMQSTSNANGMHLHLHSHSHLQEEDSMSASNLEEVVPPNNVGEPCREGMREGDDDWSDL